MLVWPDRKNYIKSIYEKKSQVYRIHHLNEGDPQPVFVKPSPLPKSETSPKVALKPTVASSDEINSENSVKLGEEEFTPKAMVPGIKDSSPNNTLIDSEEDILTSKTKILSSIGLNDSVSPQFDEKIKILRRTKRCKEDKGDKNESVSSQPNQVTPKAKKATRNKNQSIGIFSPQTRSLKQKKTPKKVTGKLSD